MDITGKEIEELINSLNDVDFDVRSSVSDILVKIEKPAVEHLISALHHPDPDIRVESARILGRIGDKEALEPLIMGLKDNDVRFRKEVASSINKILDH